MPAQNPDVSRCVDCRLFQEALWRSELLALYRTFHHADARSYNSRIYIFISWRNTAFLDNGSDGKCNGCGSPVIFEKLLDRKNAIRRRFRFTPLEGLFEDRSCKKSVRWYLLIDGCHILSIEPPLDQLYNCYVANDKSRKNDKEYEWRLDEPEDTPDYREWQDRRDKYDKDRTCEKIPARPAGVKRNYPGPDDKYHECLGTDGLDEPGCLEERRLGFEDKYHDAKGQEVEDGTDRAESDHEVADKGRA